MDPLLTTLEPLKNPPYALYGQLFENRSRRIWLAIFIIVILLLGGWMIGLGLNQGLPVTAKTILIVTRPNLAQTALPPAVRQTLPAVWQAALSGSSNWPVLLGAGLGSNGWEWFALVPRFRSMPGLPNAAAGLARIAYDQTPVQPLAQVTYGQTLLRWLRAPRQTARGEIALDSFSASSSLVTFTYHDRIVHTSLRFKQSAPAFTPRLADISLDISSLEDTARDELLAGLPVPGFARFPSLKELHVNFRQPTTSETVQLVHVESLSPLQITHVLAGFGITAKHVFQLADGTLATELTRASGNMTQPVHINHHDTLLIHEREIRYGSSTELLPSVPLACNNVAIMGRLSANALQKLAQSIGLVFDAALLKSWQLGAAHDGTLVLCEE